MADIGLFSFYGGFSQAWAILNDVNIGIIRFYGRLELRDLLGCCWESVSRARRDTSSNDPCRQAPPESDTFFNLRISFIWNGEWRNEFPEDHRRLKGRYTRGILLPEHAPEARSGSKFPPCVPTISWVHFILGSRISTPQNAPRYLTS